MYKLLVVDDEKMIRIGIANGIDWKSIGIGMVYMAASAMEALEIIQEEHPQIMVTDISMAQMSGLDLVERIRVQMGDEDMRILILTGYDRFEYARQCLTMRVQNFLLKPIDEKELKKTVQQEVQKLDEIRKDKELEIKKVRIEGTRRQAALEEFMRGLIHKRIAAKQFCPEELRAESRQSMQAALLIPEIEMDDGKGTEEDFRRMTIKNICMTLIDDRREGITFTDDHGRIVLIFYTFCANDGDSGESITEKSRQVPDRNITERVEELCKILEDECEVTPRVVLGSEVTGFEKLFISYNDAIYLLEQEEQGVQEIIRSEEAQNREKIIREVYREFKQAMIANVANGDQVMHIYDQFKQAVISYNLSKRQVQRWCFELFSSLYFSCFQETGEKTEGSLDSLLMALAGSDREEVMEVTGTFLYSLLFQENKNQHEIIAKAKRYIEEHLESDLSMTSLAAMFYMSPNYFSRLFKKVIGEGCNEYVVKKRIEKSKLLLETTTIKTGKIAVMVGYNDTNYFSLAFKKNIGMSPTKYREIKQKM